MDHKCWVCTLMVALVLCSSACAEPPCYVVDENGVEHRIASWNRLVVREVEPAVVDRGRTAPAPLDSPGVTSAFIYQRAVIPVEDLQYMLPALGVYVLKDGHRIEANPLASCGFSKEHRFIDLEHPRYRSTAGGLETSSQPGSPLLLEVIIDYAVTDTVAGYPVAEPRSIAVQNARIVVFDPEAVEAARKSWAAAALPPGQGGALLPYAAGLRTSSDLRAAPGGEGAGRISKGAAVEVLEFRGEWARIRVEGWVKREAVEEKP